jgi:hypothetical protein
MAYRSNRFRTDFPIPPPSSTFTLPSVTGRAPKTYQFPGSTAKPLPPPPPPRATSCLDILKQEGIATRKDFRSKWALKNHPDRGGDTVKFQKVSDCVDQLGARRRRTKKRIHTKKRRTTKKH